jgi:hypothetical protein
MGVGSSISNLGPIDTFTYTISNPFPLVAITRTNSTISLTWPGAASARYTVESTHGLNPAVWMGLSPFTNMTGSAGDMTRSIPLDSATNEFFRIKVE